MNVKDLIAMLQTMPGDATVNCGGQPIWFVEALPGYYDGTYKELIFDGGGYPSGIRICRDGQKVIIRTMGMEEVINYTSENSKDAPKVPYATLEFRGGILQRDVDAFSKAFKKIADEISKEEKIIYLQDIVET